MSGFAATGPATFGRACFVQVHRAAIVLGLSARTVRRYCEEKTIPATRVGGVWLVPVSYLRGLGR